METVRNEAASGSDNDFKALFEQSARAPRPGQVVRGRVVDVSHDYVTVDIGYKSEGLIPVAEFTDRDGNVEVQPGDEIDVYLVNIDRDMGGVELSRVRAEQLRVWNEIEEAERSGKTIEGTIVGKVKGGLKVDIGVPAFLPNSQVDVRPARSLDRYIGQRMQFAVIKCNRARGNVVLSRRKVIEEEREQMRKETLSVLEEGVILEGVVKNITDYGAFVDLGGIDGLLHVTDMAWGRVNHPSDVVKVGDRVRVVVLKYDPDRGRVSLGMKQIQPDPWQGVSERYHIGARVRGKVVNITDYGAFVELEPGVEGLVHVSEMSWTKRVVHPSKIVEPNQEVEVVVLDVDEDNRRISLGLKQAVPNPWDLLRINHPVGSRVTGVVKHITDFGVFVGIAEGIDGLVHVSDMHWTKKIKHPSELYKKGDTIEAVVLSIDPENERVALGVKQLTEDPWNTMAQRYPVGSRVRGKVTSVTDFGVFVELEEGVEGLIHVSQLSHERVDKPQDMFEPGQEVEAEVTLVDPKDRKISLSIRALRRTEERMEMESYLQRDRNQGRFSLQDIMAEQLRVDTDKKESSS
jgi:small subunit ribosomal protein S1